jgi:hypothetical protein
MMCRAVASRTRGRPAATSYHFQIRRSYRDGSRGGRRRDPTRSPLPHSHSRPVLYTVLSKGLELGRQKSIRLVCGDKKMPSVFSIVIDPEETRDRCCRIGCGTNPGRSFRCLLWIGQELSGTGAKSAALVGRWGADLWSWPVGSPDLLQGWLGSPNSTV